jgi:hypothetical protein
LIKKKKLIIEKERRSPITNRASVFTSSVDDFLVLPSSGTAASADEALDLNHGCPWLRLPIEQQWWARYKP